MKTFTSTTCIFLLAALPLVGAAAADLDSERPSSATLKADRDHMSAFADYYEDTDQDGIPTRYDQCQNSAPGVPVNQHGCELDSDGDGIYDHNDACPNTPKGRSVNFLGCQADSDGDGVLDYYDQCPGTPLGTQVDATGCPSPAPAASLEEDLEQKPQSFAVSHIIFNLGSYELRTDQRQVIDQDFAQLSELDATQYLLVTGFTDNIGSTESNVQLSWNRAQTIKKYLVEEHAVPSEQVFVYGLGESKPVASNATAEGRAENRRIEFQLIADIDELPDAARLEIPDDLRGYQRFPDS